ncbi:ABC transporter permease [Carbonactinospora thermoautotrophica]|uniref:ABC transporter permease n=1 Tax=Carbonactinospora thermoautotrophica TaxID=1469144 RepID=UPI003DA8AD89
MLTFSLRSLLAHKLRLALTVAAVTLGVAFVSGSFVLSDTMGKAFDQLFGGLAKGTDVIVRAHSTDPDAQARGQTRPLDQSVVDTVRRVPGVAAAEGSVTGYALILDKAGKPIQPGGAPTLGGSMRADRSLASEFTFRAGRAPAAPTEVALDAGTAKKTGYRVGDRVKVVFEHGTDEFTVVGIVGFGDTDNLVGATMASFETRTAQKLLGKTGKVDQVDVRAADGVSAVQLRDRIARALPAGAEAVTSEQVVGESSRSIRDGLGMFTKVLLAFAGVSLLVGSFVIWNTFSVLVAQRRREVALLRAVGATRRQVLGGLITEAGIIGLVSAGLGLAAGIGLAAGLRTMLDAVGMEVPTTSPVIAARTVIVALLIGVVVTVVAAVVPALAATRVAPVGALRAATPAASGRIGTARRLLGAGLLTAGTAGLGAAAVVKNQGGLTALSALVAFTGLVTAGPLLARAIAWAADRGRPGGWRMAARNIGRAPQRAAATALALTIGLAVVCAVSVTAASTKASVAEAVNGGNRSDLILRPAAAMGTGGISPAVADILRGRDDLAAVMEVRFSHAKVNGTSTNVAGVETGTLDRVMNLGLASGSLAGFRDGTLLLSTKQAQALGAKVGDTVTLTFPETGAKTFTVAATFERDSLVGAGYVLTLRDYASNVTSRLDAAILVKYAAGADQAATKADVTKALAAYPNVKVEDQAEFVKDQQAHVDQMLGLVTALLLLAVIVAVLGIINTLVLSVVERTRELGLLRAVGATRRQVRAMVRRESVLMALLGALAGVTLGTGAGVALARSLADQGISSLSVPVSALLGYVVVAALVGVLAAVGPARRASRVDVLKAITVD